MFPTFIDKLSSIFDRRFIVAFWLPGFVFVALLTGVVIIIYGLSPTLLWWDNLSASGRLIGSVFFLFLTLILALLLQPFSVSLTRVYLGYWPRTLSYFIKWGKGREREFWTPFQVSDERLLPTRLGNVLASNYEYAHRVYQIDPAIWLPRLTPLMPETFRAQMDNALTPMFCLINLSSIFSALAVVGGLLVVFLDQRSWLFLLIWIAGLLLALICYRASISQSAEYGTFIRVAFDLYRPELIKQLRFALPDTPQKEFALWGRLGKWVHFREAHPGHPWADPENPSPLNYENYRDPGTVIAKAVDVSVKSPIQLKIDAENNL
jgi:hypothetical protein